MIRYIGALFLRKKISIKFGNTLKVIPENRSCVRPVAKLAFAAAPVSNLRKLLVIILYIT